MARKKKPVSYGDLLAQYDDEIDNDPKQQLREMMFTRFRWDLMDFVMFAFPWGEIPKYSMVKLKEPWRSRYNVEYGPDEWACRMFDDISAKVKKNGFNIAHPTNVDPIRVAVTSGHGIGKTFASSMLIFWIMSTRPRCEGTISATTMSQISTKTWASVKDMQKDCITGDWFEITTGKNAMTMRNKDADKEKWMCNALTSREENSEAFAGQHSATSTSFYLFDEASGIPDKIWEVAEGGLTDGEPMMFVFGNPTKNYGKFYEIFNNPKNAKKWLRYKVDSRNVQITNKKQHKEWIEEYGEDSDFVRVRIKGEFPNSATSQFIPTDAVDRGMELESPPFGEVIDAVPIVGVDVARYGDDATVMVTRVRGDARSVQAKYLRNMDGQEVGARVVDHAQELMATYNFPKVHVFFDRANVGTSVSDYFKYNLSDTRVICHAVDFGAKPIKTEQYLNKRAEMWSEMRKALIEGLAIENTQTLKEELITPEYQFTKDKGLLQLESKKDIKARLKRSPDYADALALTFADPNVEKQGALNARHKRKTYNNRDVDPTTVLDRCNRTNADYRSY